MKISPLKNYSRPTYAVKLAALLTAAAAVSGCAEGGGKPANTTGAGYKAETATTTVTTTTSAEVQGMFPNTEECIELSGKVAPYEETTTYEETIPVGTYNVPEDTGGTTTTVSEPAADDTTTSALTAAVTAAVTTTAAGTTLSGTYTTTKEPVYEETRLAGGVEVPKDYSEPEIDGDVYMPKEYEEPEIMGDFPANEEPDDFQSSYYLYAERNFPVFYEAFSKFPAFRVSFIDDFDSGETNVAVVFSENNSYDIYGIAAPYKIELLNKNTGEYEFLAYVDFMGVYGYESDRIRETGERLDGGYLCEGEANSESVQILFVETYGDELIEELCEGLASCLAKFIGAV